MGVGVKRTQRDYTLAFKLAVVEQVEHGELTYKEAQTRYVIQERSTVLIWCRKHGHLDWYNLSSSDLLRPEMTNPPLATNARAAYQSPRSRIERGEPQSATI